MNLDPAIKIIEEFEGLRLKAYRDQAGIWTIGYGTTHYPDGREVKQGDRCTESQAYEWFHDDLLNVRVPAIEEYVRVPLSVNETCAILSFVYNIGKIAFKGSTFLKKLNSGKSSEDVASEFLKWVNVKGRVSVGQVQRRELERLLFLKKDEITQKLA